MCGTTNATQREIVALYAQTSEIGVTDGERALNPPRICIYTCTRLHTQYNNTTQHTTCPAPQRKKVHRIQYTNERRDKEAVQHRTHEVFT